MRIVSFNINGIRARPHQLVAIRDQLDPDIIGLQETKVQDAEFPFESVRELGYEVEIFGQKGHYGVALLSKKPPIRVIKGFADDHAEAQRRLISATYSLKGGKELTVINGYFPQGESRSHAVKFPAKEKFYADLLRYLQTLRPEDNLCVLGDMNVSHTDRDIGIGDDNKKRWLQTGKCSFLPEEREWLQRLLDWGLVDTWRDHHPQVDDQFSWFDYRSKGFEREPKRGLRIDLILASKALQAYCRDTGISHSIRAMDKPSDHCPVWADFAL